MAGWPWTFATLPAGNVAASKLDDNFNAAMFSAGSSTNGAVPTWNGTGGNALNTGGLVVGTAANNLVQLDGSGNLPSSVAATLSNIYVTMKQISSFPFSFSYTPKASTNILVIEVDITDANGQGNNATLSVSVNGSTLNSGYVQQTNTAFMAGPLRVIAPYQLTSGAAVTIAAAFSGSSATNFTIWMKVTEVAGIIA